MKKKQLIFIIPVAAVVLTVGVLVTLTGFGVLRLDPFPYRFPMTPESPEWVNLSSSEKDEAYQIPERKLKRMTTKALLETVSYPFLLGGVEALYPRIEDMYSFLSYQSNGFDELFSRPDITETLLNKYKNTRILSAEDVKAYMELENPTMKQTVEFLTTYGAASDVEFLFELNKLKNGSMSDETFAVLSELTEQKNAEREAEHTASGDDLYSNSMYYPDQFEAKHYEPPEQ